MSVIFFSTTGWAVTAQETKATDITRLTATLNTDSANIGSIIDLTLAISLTQGATLTTPPQITRLEGLTVVGQKLEPDRIIIRLMVDRLGSWKTGRLTLSYLDAQNKIQTLTSEAVSVQVESGLGEKPEEAQLRPIQGITPIIPVWLKYLPWAAGAIAALLIGLGLFWWFRWRRRNKRLQNMQDPPHVRARKRIQQLEAQGLFERGDRKAFYFRLSEIMRHYLEALRRFPAAEFTTEEIASRIANEQDRKLLDLLRQADLVKFADDIPSMAKKEEQVKTALSYIQETTPITVLDRHNERTGDTSG